MNANNKQQGNNAAQHPVYQNCDMFTLEELFDDIILAQSQELTQVASNNVCCDVDSVADSYPE